jgi:hypothetical protein
MRFLRPLPFVAAALAAQTVLASAAVAQGTVNLTLTGPVHTTGSTVTIGTNPIGPFNLQRNTPTSTFQGFSIDFDGVQPTAAWTARSVRIADMTSTDFAAFVKSLGTASTQGTLPSVFDATNLATWQQRLRAAAELANGFGASPTTSWDERQYAIWSLFSTASPTTLVDVTAGNTLRTNAMTTAGTNPNNYGQWRVLIDNNAYNTAYTGTMNRAFITTSAVVTPEPSTYALMVTGLVGLGVAARRRRAAGATPA